MRARRRAGMLTGMTVAIVGTRANRTSVRLAAEWRSLGIAARLVDAAAARTLLEAGDLALGRLDVRASLDGVEPGLLDLLRLESSGVPVRNRAFALVAVHDKLLMARRLRAAGIPHPRTAVVRSAEDPLPLPAPLVLKPRFGSWGRDIFRCDRERDARHVLRAVSERPWFRRHGAVVQELVPSRYRDLRVVVAGGRVIGAIHRTAAPGEWRTNISLGGTRTPVVPDAAARVLAVSAAAALGGDLVGVDLLPLATGGHVVVELNGAVDFDEHYSLPGRDVFRDAAAGLMLEPATTLALAGSSP